MNWLFWKEYRQNRVVVFALVVMMIVPHLFGLYAMGYQWAHRGWETLLQDWRGILAMTSVYSFVISQVALAVIGGNVIAGERADRSAEFQIYLPLTRKRILAGKLLLVSAIAAAIWLINPLIILGVWASANFEQFPKEISESLTNPAITGLVFFCMAWFFSTFLRSPTFSVISGLATPVIIWSLISFGWYLVHGETWYGGKESILQTWYVCLSLAVVFPSFGIGTWLFLRRVEP